MADPRVVGADELLRLVPLESAIAAVEDAFLRDDAVVPERSHVDAGGGSDLLLMPAWSSRGIGVKLVTVNPANRAREIPLVQGIYVLFDRKTLGPLAVFDGAAITALRTPAVSAVATNHLARPDAERLVIFGAGTQALAHLDAMRAVRPVAQVTVVSRTRSRAETACEEARSRGLGAWVGGPDAVAAADLVCTCTTSATPVFPGALLPPGSLVNAVGAYKPVRRELDDKVVRKAKIVVESRSAALAEAGDLLIPLANEVITEAALVADLAELVRGKQVRSNADDITVFKSVGLASEDLAIATAAWRSLVAEGA